MSRYVDLDEELYLRDDGEYENYNVRLDAPSIDICFCGECKYWHDHITSSWCSRGAELRPQESGWIKRNADDFCSYGCRSEKPNNSERSSE